MPFFLPKLFCNFPTLVQCPIFSLKGGMLPITSGPLHFLDSGFLAQYKICLMEPHLSFANLMSIIQEVAPFLIGFSLLPWE